MVVCAGCVVVGGSTAVQFRVQPLVFLLDHVMDSFFENKSGREVSERLRHDHKGKDAEFRKIDAAGTRAKRPHAAGCVYKPVTASHGSGIQRYYHDRKIAL